MTPRRSAEREFERFVRRLDRGDRAGARSILDRLERSAPDALSTSRARLEWLRSEGEAALTPLKDHVERFPEDVDARHELGHELLREGQHLAAVEHWLRVRDQDAAADRAHGVGGPATRAFVAREAAQTLDGLPDRFRELISDVPIVLEERPSAELVRSGFDPRAYGLFEGSSHTEQRSIETFAAPTRIVLFVDNLAADFPRRDELAEQVAITVQHEVGHYFGLDEDDLERLGLD